MNNVKVITYGGYYSTGGSIIRDMFREFEPNFELSTEFRLLKEHYGLLDLERVIFDDYAPENIDLAIKDFIWFANNLARKSGRLRKAGFSYDEKTCGAFSKATQYFIEQITDYEYPMSWHFDDFKRSYVSQILRRTVKKLFIKNVRNNQSKSSARLAYPSREKYIYQAQRYMNSILSGIQKYNKSGEESVVGLHNAIPLFSMDQINKSLAYFSSCKIIIVDRDPRDVFMNYPKDSYGRYVPLKPNLVEKAKGFIHFYKSIRKNQTI